MKIMRLKTYLNMIEKSVGTTMFQNLYMENEKREVLDAAAGGELSCAIFVSSVLTLNNLLDSPRAWVDKTTENMKKAGWYEIKENEVKAGAVIVWENGMFSSGPEHKHNGFYVGNEMAVSNSTKAKTPIKHHWKKDGRGVESVWWHKDLD